MSQHRLLFPVVLLLAACATPAPKPATPATPASPKATRVSLFCGPSARTISFETLGVPSDELPVSVAVDARYAYVLFPSRLLRVPSTGDSLQAETTLGRGKDLWVDMDLDPADGSVWIATDKFLLRRITTDWQNEVVEVHRVEGDGGFDGIQVGRDAVYASPVCADDAVWRLDRAGNVLSSAFPIPELVIGEEPLDPIDLTCSKVRLERDGDGNVVAWNYGSRQVFRADGQGVWAEVDPGFFKEVSMHPSTAKGVDVGGATEQWYVAGQARRLFYWKGRPAFLGTYASGGGPTKTSTVVIVPEEGGTREVLDQCGGQFILGVATTSDRYAAITHKGLILGELATAPDLP